MTEDTDTPDGAGHDEGVSLSDNVEFVDKAPDEAFSKVGVVKNVEPQRPHHELNGFAVNLLPAGHPPGFTQDVIGWFEDRYSVERFDHNEPVGVVIVDADDHDTVFPIGMKDTLAFSVGSVAPDAGGDVVEGNVAVIGRSGTLRVEGVGAVNVEPEDVVEVTERYDPDGG